MVEKIGFTTSIPIEVLIAAGKVPVDLNNIFVMHPENYLYVEKAEMDGFPRNTCSWIKGIYTASLEGDIGKVIAVTQGDCSDTKALMEVFEMYGLETIPFAYPYDRDRDMLKLQIEKLMDYFGVSWHAVNKAKKRLDKVRHKLQIIDKLTWKKNVVSGYDNHLYLVQSSDMNGNLDEFEKKVDNFIEDIRQLQENNDEKEVRLGYVGVPPIVSNLHDFIESLGGRIVYNEIQRQFSMPFATDDLVEQYRQYTYPYDIFGRIKDIKEQIEKRRIRALIHYVQSFCFRQIEDLILRKMINIPILTLEGDMPAKLDARSKIRIEGFIDMLEGYYAK